MEDVRFVYFQRFDEFFPQLQFFHKNQKFVYFPRFDKFFHYFRFSESPPGIYVQDFFSKVW